MDKEKFGKLITQLRQQKNVSQKEMAETLHISSSGVCKWEKGMTLPDIELLIKIAEYFEISCDDLLHPERMLVKPIEDDICIPEIPAKKHFFQRKFFYFGLAFSAIIMLLLWGYDHLLTTPRTVRQGLTTDTQAGQVYEVTILTGNELAIDDIELQGDIIRSQWHDGVLPVEQDTQIKLSFRKGLISAFAKQDPYAELYLLYYEE